MYEKYQLMGEDTMTNPTAPGPAAPGAAPTGAKPATAPTAAKPEAEKKEPKAKEPKVAKPKKEGVAPRPRLPKYPDEHLITVLKPNAKARGANERFQRYVTGMTVKQYVEKIREDFARTDGQTYADMRWDEDHKFIHIGPTVVPVPAPPVAQPAAGTAAPASA
jgi:hypothetical protein